MLRHRIKNLVLGDLALNLQSRDPDRPRVNADRRHSSVMSFGIYLLGFLILIGGLIYGATLLHIAGHWIAVGALVLIGLALLKGVQATRGKDPSQ